MYIIQKDTQNGLDYVENSAAWKYDCSTLPCSAEMWWPGYLTKVVRINIRSEPVIIQLWKGWCPRLGGRWGNFPGGMGAEVGIYRTVADDDPNSQRYLFKQPVTKADKGLHAFRDKLSSVAEKIPHLQQVTPFLPRHDRPHGAAEGEVWYPYPELQTHLWFKLVNPWTGETFFETSKQSTWWLTRWMAPDSYRNKYKQEHPTPAFPADYKLYYTVNGIACDPW